MTSDDIEILTSPSQSGWRDNKHARLNKYHAPRGDWADENEAQGIDDDNDTVEKGGTTFKRRYMGSRPWYPRKK